MPRVKAPENRATKGSTKKIAARLSRKTAGKRTKHSPKNLGQKDGGQTAQPTAKTPATPDRAENPSLALPEATPAAGAQSESPRPDAPQPESPKRETMVADSPKPRTGKTASAKSDATSARAVPNSPLGEMTVTVDRRRVSDRRSGVERRQQNIPVAVERRQLERRAKVARRRQIDPTTCERDYSLEEIEFMIALDEYKRASGRMFPTCSEILEVLRKLGYERRTGPSPDAAPADGVANQLGQAGQVSIGGSQPQSATGNRQTQTPINCAQQESPAHQSEPQASQSHSVAPEMSLEGRGPSRP